jgi:diguanylate cyclase (GGDEF)-like protein
MAEALSADQRAIECIDEFRGSGWILVDHSLKVIWANTGAQRIFETQQLVGLSAVDLVHPEDLNFVLEVLDHHHRSAREYADRLPVKFVPEGAEIRIKRSTGWAHVIVRLENRLDEPGVEALVIRFDHVAPDPGFMAAIAHLANGAAPQVVLESALRSLSAENHDTDSAIIWWDPRGRNLTTLGHIDAALTHPSVYEFHKPQILGSFDCISTLLVAEMPVGITRLAAEEAGWRSAWIVRLRSVELGALGVLVVWNRYDYHVELRPQMAITVAAQICTLTLNEHRRRGQLQQLAESDPLTGLLNRAGLRAAHERICQTTAQPMSALFIDLDEFKPLNDRYGHRLGDLALSEVGSRLSSLCRGDDIVARVGGDEFLVVCPGLIDPQFVSVAASRILDELRRPMLLADPGLGMVEIHLQASIGVAMTESPSSLDALMSEADSALYEAKRAGKGRFMTATDRHPTNASR